MNKFDSGLSDKINKNLWEITPTITSIFITTLIICIICIIYNIKIRNHNPNKKVSGFLVLINLFVTSIENVVVSIMGRKHKYLTPYAMYIVLYIFVGSLISMLGFESPSTSLTITFAMSFVTFIMIYYFGIRFQKFAYFKKFLNPIELFTQFTPLLSLAFRLFGNLLGGTIIITLLYVFLISLQSGFVLPISDDNGIRELLGSLNLFTTVLMPLLHIYFDIFDGLIQSAIFLMLTLSYWAEAGKIKNDEEVIIETKTKINTKKIQQAKI